MLFFNQETQAKEICSMEKYPEELCAKMREIFKLIMKRIRDEGKLVETDVLFIHLYKTEFERNTTV
jgi:hypothetical protein